MPVTQSSQNVFSRRSHTPTVEPPLHGGRQDKRALTFARRASPQPAPHKKHILALNRTLETKTPRSQKSPHHTRRSAKVTTWVKPVVSAELQRIAVQEGLSVSAAGAALLEEAIRQKLHVQHAVLLQPIIEQAIRREMQAFGNRLAFLLVRSCFTSEQTRSIVTNILGRQMGITPDMLKTILDNSSKTAKRNMTRRTPQLETIITELEQALERETDGS